MLFHSEPQAHAESWIQLHERRPGNSICSFWLWQLVVFAKTHTQLHLEQKLIFSH